MGSAAVQGTLWGARAKDWAEIQEPSWRAIFETALGHAGVRPGIALLDVGCGAGGALVAASGLGAEVAGLDASQALVAIARERLPGARIEVGEMEEMPFDDESFDVVTGINAFQFAAAFPRALAEARRVVRPGGTVFMLMWGRREYSPLLTTIMPAVFALLPPAQPGGMAPIAFAAEGVVEGYMREAGLRPVAAGEFSGDLAFDDAATAARAVASASARAIAHAGEDQVLAAIRGTLPPLTRPDGSVAWSNRFRWVRAER